MLDYVLSLRRLKFKVFFQTLSKLIKTWICCSKHNKRIIWLIVLLFSIFLMLFLMSLVPYVSYIVFIQFVLEIVFWNSILFQSIQNTLLLIQLNSFVFEKSDLITATSSLHQVTTIDHVTKGCQGLQGTVWITLIIDHKIAGLITKQIYLWVILYFWDLW